MKCYKHMCKIGRKMDWNRSSSADGITKCFEYGSEMTHEMLANYLRLMAKWCNTLMNWFLVKQLEGNSTGYHCDKPWMLKICITTNSCYLSLDQFAFPIFLHGIIISAILQPEIWICFLVTVLMREFRQRIQKKRIFQ